MQYFGYNKKFRYEIVDSALKAYKLRQEAEQKGEKTIHRPKAWKKEERIVERTRKKENWYKKRGDEAVIFVPATPGLRLQKKYLKEIREIRLQDKGS